jgi:hypothetical protein
MTYVFLLQYPNACPFVPDLVTVRGSPFTTSSKRSRDGVQMYYHSVRWARIGAQEVVRKFE